jgi:hypothetical protein
MPGIMVCKAKCLLHVILPGVAGSLRILLPRHTNYYSQTFTVEVKGLSKPEDFEEAEPFEFRFSASESAMVAVGRGLGTRPLRQNPSGNIWPFDESIKLMSNIYYH